MTVYVDDNDVCECGAYFEETGYCVNGHIKLVKRTLEDLTAEVARLRALVLERVGLVKSVQKRLNESSLADNARDANVMLQSAQADLEEAEAVAKIAAEIHNQDTGEKKGFGWQAKDFKTIDYTDEKALDWARSKPSSAGLVGLKKKPFEKAARALIETGMIEGLEFVELGKETRIQLTKELG